MHRNSSLATRSLKFWKIVRPFVFIFLILSAFRSAIADWNDVPTGSMIPTILEGDRIFVNKLAYDLKIPFSTTHLLTWSSPRRGDIVVFFSPANGERLVKRVIAIPGDVVELRDNRLSINGDASTYGPIDPKTVLPLSKRERQGHIFATETNPLASHSHAVMATPMISARRSFAPITIPPDHYFMMGDNRDNSADSRYFGLVDRSRIVGHAVVIVASLDLNNHWLPRWGRLFKSLP